jgi:formate dehydrogenase alpha subunit
LRRRFANGPKIERSVKIMADEKEEKITIPTAPEPEASPTAIAPWWEKAAPDMAEITIDGKSVRFEKGGSLFNACKQIGVLLPAMCYHHSFSPFGSCGVCLVEVEGKSNNVRACTAKVTPGMVVWTDTEKIKDARKKAIEKHLLVHPLDCPVCDADGKCELQDMTYDMGVYNIAEPKRKEIPEDTRSVVLDFNMNRCILCGQCINVCKEVQLIDALCFYKKDKQTHVGAHGGVPLYCEFCGDCLAVCPVGAIVSRFSKYAFKPWQLKKTETTCTYCSDGCSLTIESEQQKVTRVTSDLSYRSKFGLEREPGEGHGGTCVRGRFGFQVFQSPKRLSRPLVRKDGGLSETSWFEAMRVTARGFAEIKAAHGPKAIAGLITARCTNEEVYLFQKFMRLTLGTNNLDSPARYGLMNAVLPMRRALGVGRSMVDFKEIALANLLLLVGTDITETHPVESLRVKEALSRETAKVVVIDPIKTNMAKLASIHLQPKAGTEFLAISGMIKIIIEKSLVDPEFAERHPGAAEALRKATEGLSIEEIGRATGLSIEKLSEAAEMLVRAPREAILFGEGILSRSNGSRGVEALIDLAMVSGVFRKEGSGLHPISEENNEQGTVDMGGVAEFLPGQRSASDPAARSHFASLWREELPAAEGARLPEIIERARRGEIKALYLVGENPLGTLPASSGVAEALRSVEFIVCQDPFLTETGEMAHVVLPAAMAVEKEGTFTNVEGKICRVAPSFDPIGESRPDWKIFSDLSRRLGFPLLYRGPEEIRQEIMKAVPGYYRPERPRLDPRAMEGYLGNGYAEEALSRYRPENAASSGAMRVVLGQIIYHSGKLSTRDEGLMKIFPEPRLQMNPSDAERLSLAGGGKVRLRSEWGEAETTVEIREEVPPGLLFYPEHFNAEGVKDLFECAVDPKTGVISFKMGSIEIVPTA